MTPEEIKASLKEGLKEWMDEKFITFGKWSMLSIAALALTALIYFILLMDGWKK